MATVITSGTHIEVQNVTCNGTTDTQVTFTNTPQSVTIQCRDAVAIQIRDSDGGTPYYTLASGGVISFYLYNSSPNLWIRTSSGSHVVEVIGVYGD